MWLLANRSEAGKLMALDRSQAIIEFSTDGTILTANANFLAAMGYTLAEVEGRMHSLFVDPAEQQSAAYRTFWDDLRRGTFQSREFRRIAKGGREVWIQASYNPILDRSGRVVRIVKFASDITAQKRQSLEATGQIAAINRSQAVIQFTLDGVITDANANFLATMGYSLDEIKGRHHSLFVNPAEWESAAYAAFWQALGAGQFRTGEFKGSTSKAVRSGSTAPTIPSSMQLASRTPSSSSPATSRIRFSSGRYVLRRNARSR